MKITEKTDTRPWEEQVMCPKQGQRLRAFVQGYNAGASNVDVQAALHAVEKEFSQQLATSHAFLTGYKLGRRAK